MKWVALLFFFFFNKKSLNWAMVPQCGLFLSQQQCNKLAEFMCLDLVSVCRLWSPENLCNFFCQWSCGYLLSQSKLWVCGDCPFQCVGCSKGMQLESELHPPQVLKAAFSLPPILKLNWLQVDKWKEGGGKKMGDEKLLAGSSSWWFPQLFSF